jgi:hypothetical protein
MEHMGISEDPEKETNAKTQKLKGDLEVVMENVVLTNNIIDTCVEEKKMDGLLPEMINTLKGLEGKVRKQFHSSDYMLCL